MEYRKLGASGLKLSELSFGSWVTFSHQSDIDNALACMTAAYDAGVNFFDNAEIYAHGKAEEIMGAALKKAGWDRDSYIISSKVMWGCRPDSKPTQRGLSRKHVVEACDQALQRMQLDYLDLYLMHWPVAMTVDPDPEKNTMMGAKMQSLEERPIIETWKAMEELVDKGLVKDIGVSNFSRTKLQALLKNCRIPPAVNQVELHPYLQQNRQLKDFCDSAGIRELQRQGAVPPVSRGANCLVPRDAGLCHQSGPDAPVAAGDQKACHPSLRPMSLPRSQPETQSMKITMTTISTM